MAKRRTISLRDKTPKEKEDIQLLSEFKKHIEDWYSYYADNNTNFHADTNAAYAYDGLWTKAEIKQYSDEGRPRLTFNMLPKFITNAISLFSTRGADLEVRPKGTFDTPQQNIDIYANILRNISLSSRNNIVYKTALQNAVTGGYGTFLINVEKKDPLSFLHIIKYKSIYDPTTCGWDVKARDVDKSDGQLCFMGQEISKDEFKARYPGESLPEDPIEGSRFVDWVSDTGVVLMNLWKKEPITVEMAQLSDGQEVPVEKADELIKANRKIIKLFPGERKLEIVKTEKMLDHKIMFYIFSNEKIYERKEWLGKRLPLPFVPGILRWVDKEEKTFSLIRWQKDAQRAYNYARNEYLYRMMLQTYWKVMATDENIGEHIDVWENPTQAKGPLRYKVGPHGEVPQVLPNPSVGNDLQNEMNRSLQDLQSITGRFDQNFGEQGNEISRVAIDGRRSAGNANIKEIYDNMEDVVESGAITSMELIPKVYDSERSIAVTLPNGKTENQTINSGDTQLEQIQFTVEVKVGPNLDLQQENEARTLMGLTQSNPQLHQFVDDIIVKNLDIQNSPQIVERIRRYMIPQIAASEGSKDPVVQQQVQKQQQTQQQQQQMQQQMLMLKIKDIIQTMQINQQKSKDDTIKAQASMLTSTANMMNAQTNQGEAVTKGMQETQKLQAEEDKSQNELQIELLKLLKEMEQVGGPTGINVGNINQALQSSAVQPQEGLV